MHNIANRQGVGASRRRLVPASGRIGTYEILSRYFAFTVGCRRHLFLLTASTADRLHQGCRNCVHCRGPKAWSADRIGAE